MATFTGKGITVYRYVVAKHAIALGEIAKRHGGYSQNARNWARQMRTELGLRPRANAATIIAEIDRRLETLVPEVRAEGGISE